MGRVEEVDGAIAISDESGLQTKSLEHLNLGQREKQSISLLKQQTSVNCGHGKLNPACWPASAPGGLSNLNNRFLRQLWIS